MKQKIRVGIIFGGRSAEHEISLLSAKNIVEAIDPKKYAVTLIGIDQSGRWNLKHSADFLLHTDDPTQIVLGTSAAQIGLVPGDTNQALMAVTKQEHTPVLDVVFPILHGPFGEDGTIQGMLKLTGIPFVGAGVLGSAVGMDKDVMKRLLREAGLPVGEFRTLHAEEEINEDELIRELGLPLFVKPANLGSSVGISKVIKKEELAAAIKHAFEFDRKVVLEAHIPGREIECGVLGNNTPRASTLGEIKSRHVFYSYEAKYLDPEGAELIVPAKLPGALTKKIQKLAVRAFQVLECAGMARVDFFVSAKGEVFISEINTIPGFTKISMYPRLWQASGIAYSALVDRLIELALERSQAERSLKTSYE
jgi:D-alanine-D-alanine ligase